MRIAAFSVVAMALLWGPVAPGFAAALVNATASATTIVTADVTARSAWVRANAPGSDQASAYFNLRNASRKPVTLIGISAAGATRASVQATVIANGVSGVRDMPRVELLPGETVMFQPGGMQVMLSGITGQLKPGKTLPLTLAFEDGRELRVTATIKPLATP